MILVALVVLFATLAAVYKYVQREKYKDVQKIPGPKGVFLLGNALEFGSNSIEALAAQVKLIKEYGPFVKFWIGNQLSIIIAGPDKMEFFMGSNVHISKSRNYEFLKLWLGNGLVTAGDNHWRRHRKIITPSFHFKILEQFSDYLNSNFNILVKKLSAHVDGKPVDIHPYISLYSLDVISETSMKTKIDAQANSDARYVKAVKGFLNLYIVRFFSFFKRNKYLFKLYPSAWEQQQHINFLKNYTKTILDDRKKEMENNTVEESKTDDFGIKKKKVFLDLLLELRKDGNVLTDEEIIEEIDTIMFAGHDTVSSATSFCIYELAKHPDIQKRLVEESNDVLGDDKNCDIGFNSIRDLNFLDCVVKESLRKYAPVPFVEREIQEDIVLDGLRIPKYTTILLHIYGLHRDPKLYPEPEKFDPDRFLPQNSVKRHPYAFVPFSAGPRNCIGQRYALLNVKTTVIRFLRQFEVLESDTPHTPIFANNSVLESASGLMVKIRNRNS